MQTMAKNKAIETITVASFDIAILAKFNGGFPASPIHKNGGDGNQRSQMEWIDKPYTSVQ